MKRIHDESNSIIQDTLPYGRENEACFVGVGGAGLVGEKVMAVLSMADEAVTYVVRGGSCVCPRSCEVGKVSV